MNKRALIVGGTGQIGLASADALSTAGFEVVVAHRGARDLPVDFDFEVRLLDRDDDDAFRKATSGFDLVVDTVAYTPAHSSQLAELKDRVESLIVISTGSVYLGKDRKYFDLCKSVDEYPEFQVPIRDSNPTIDDKAQTYGALKSEMERRLLAEPGLHVSILRPSAVHGPYSPKLREFYFIKRVLDGRPHVLLSRMGASRFSTSSTSNIAALAVACALRPGSRVLNAVDEEGYSTRQIAEVVFKIMGHEAEIIGMDGAPIGNLGATPWDTPHPFVCDMSLAHESVGYIAPLTYEESVAKDLDWLMRELSNGRSWQEMFPSVVSRYGEDGWFPYQEEDLWVASK